MGTPAPSATEATLACVVCEGRTAHLGVKRGKLFARDFHFVECTECGAIFCTDPATNFEDIYDQNYYRGLGADPLVDYEYELGDPARTIRRHEWRGIGRIAQGLCNNNTQARWLDYGCGAGGLVRYGREALGTQVWGYDTGGYAARARELGLPILTEGELAGLKGSFDVITLIEVIEHIPDPAPFMANLRALLKPGGRLFLTTGNSGPHRSRFLEWGYVVPEIHVCYYTPRAMEQLFKRAGFSVAQGQFFDGWSEIVRFKVLKNLGLKRTPAWSALVPWPGVSRLLDAHLRMSAFPVGVAPNAA